MMFLNAYWVVHYYLDAYYDKISQNIVIEY